MDGKWSEWDINSRRERMTGKQEYEGKKKERQKGVEKESSDRGWSVRERGTMKGGRENKERGRIKSDREDVPLGEYFLAFSYSLPSAIFSYLLPVLSSAPSLPH